MCCHWPWGLLQVSRQKIDKLSGEVVDSNPYSRLMALQRMGIVKDYESIRTKTVGGHKGLGCGELGGDCEEVLGQAEVESCSQNSMDAPLAVAFVPLVCLVSSRAVTLHFPCLRKPVWRYGSSQCQGACLLQVAIVGMGGVGSVAAEMLTRCGIGRLLMYGECSPPPFPILGAPKQSSSYSFNTFYSSRQTA